MRHMQFIRYSYLQTHVPHVVSPPSVPVTKTVSILTLQIGSQQILFLT